MLSGLRGSSLLQGRASGTGGRAGAIPCRAVKQPGEQLPARRDSKYEPCEPSTSSLADFGTRVTLERLYTWSQPPDTPVPRGVFLVKLDDRPQRTRNVDRSEDYFANVGDAIRSLREDIPMLFQRELNYGIYREDIVFRDPRNCFKGMKNYELIFWSLRFHGKLFFRILYVDVKRIWQPEESVIKMRWTVHGIPRVPWEAEGTFDGISTYKLDSSGKIYEHCVDNILLRDPPMATIPPLLAGLNLQPLVPSQQPVPGAWCRGAAPDRQWSTSSYLRGVVASALHHMDLQLEPQLRDCPEPAVAGMAGAGAAGSRAQAHQQQQQGGSKAAAGQGAGGQAGGGGASGVAGAATSHAHRGGHARMESAGSSHGPSAGLSRR